MPLRRQFAVCSTALLCALAGCSITGDDPAALVTASVAPLEFRINGTTTVTVVVENQGDKTIHIPGGYCGVVPYRILDQSGVAVGPNEYVTCPAIAYAKVGVAPGASTRFTFEWDGTTNGPGATTHLSPGSYQVVPRLDVLGLTSAISIRSTTVTLLPAN
jgi:hypothetical protein